MGIEKTTQRAIGIYAQQSKMGLANQSSNSRAFDGKSKGRDERSTPSKDQSSFLEILNRALK